MTANSPFFEFLELPILTKAFCVEVSCNAESISAMRLSNTELDSSYLGDIAKCGFYRDAKVRFFCSLKEFPTHDSHVCCIGKFLSTLGSKLNLSCVISLVAGLAKRDEIVRSIAPSLTALNVMDVENRVFALAVTMTAFATISEKHIFTHVPKT